MLRRQFFGNSVTGEYGYLNPVEADLNINNTADYSNGAVIVAGAWNATPTTAPMGDEL